jgi:hypothetical protein
MVFSEQNLQYAFLPVKPKLCNSTQHWHFGTMLAKASCYHKKLQLTSADDTQFWTEFSYT